MRLRKRLRWSHACIAGSASIRYGSAQSADRIHGGRQLVVGSHLPEFGLHEDVGTNVDVGTSELNQNMGLAWVETMEQTEWQHIRVDHAGSDTLTEGREQR